jgi:uncharacterized damage-inducible protein DinB
MKTIRNMYEHLHWANLRLLEGFQNSKGENQQVIGLFAHVLFAEQVWLTRLQGKDSSKLPLWADATVDGCSQLVLQNDEQFTQLLTQLSNNERLLDDPIVYSNSKGQQFKTSIRDVLTHVALHGQYHRGQINTRLREKNAEPINVDYITFVR